MNTEGNHSTGRRPLRLLLVEDSEDDALFVVKRLRHGDYDLEFELVCDAESFKTALHERNWDLVIADYNLPSFSAPEALSLLKATGKDLPFIIVSGAIGEETAVAAMKAGAHDYVLKSSLARLLPVVERELGDAAVRRERRRAEDDLRKSREELRALAAHLQSVREEERKHITREIHDEFGQSLTGFKMDLVWIRNRLKGGEEPLNRQALVDKLKAMSALVDETATLVRRVCTELRPGVLDDLGLAAALEWQAREYQKRTNIKCALTTETGERQIDPDRSTALFRIFQEILTNVARHAEASAIEASLRIAGPDIVLCVRDNGKGIPKKKIAGTNSLGLLGMRERALILGGEVMIEGKPAKGTTVTVRIPLAGTKGSPSKSALPPEN